MKKKFDLTENFTTPEILNKYRHSDKDIEDKIKKNKKIIEKYENLDEIINKNIDKLKPTNDLVDNYTYISDDKNDHILDYDIDMSDIYKREYKLDDDDSILKSFSKLYQEHDIEYQPRKNTQFMRVKYLLQKMKESKNVPTNLYNHFHTSLSENNKLRHKIPTYQEEEEYQTGSSVNNIIIKDKDLNNGILRVRYLNNRILTNNLLKHDYKMSKNMVNAIKFNKDIHKLSKNEMKIYHELQKFLNKKQDINVLIGSYLSGNNSKKLYNKISSILYNKLKNNIISKKEYTKLINKINEI